MEDATSLWTNNWSSSPMAARFEKTVVMNYMLKMHRLGAATPGELPGEYVGVTVVPVTNYQLLSEFLLT